MFHILREFIDFLNSISCTHARYLCIIMTTGVNKHLLLIFLWQLQVLFHRRWCLIKCYTYVTWADPEKSPTHPRFLILACQAHVLAFNTRLQEGPKHVFGKFTTDVNLRKNFPGVRALLPRFTDACINIPQIIYILNEILKNQGYKITLTLCMFQDEIKHNFKSLLCNIIWIFKTLVCNACFKNLMKIKIAILKQKLAVQLNDIRKLLEKYHKKEHLKIIKIKKI